MLPEALEGTASSSAQMEGPLPALDRLAARTGGGSGLARLIEQAGLQRQRRARLLLIVGGVWPACRGAAGGGSASRSVGAGWLGALVGCVLPLLFLLRQARDVRLQRFEEQFPEALDLLSRAIRAGPRVHDGDGHGGRGGCRSRSARSSGRHSTSRTSACRSRTRSNNMAVRVPLLDVRFFVTAVLIQRETGGNLSEILDNLAHVVRERFKILRQVRVYTAHGRLTGYVLMALPAALAIALSFINPEHMNLLFASAWAR